jgi:hypothetical protein
MSYNNEKTHTNKRENIMSCHSRIMVCEKLAIFRELCVINCTRAWTVKMGTSGKLMKGNCSDYGRHDILSFENACPKGETGEGL